ncbi:hypothetical protein [Niallia sp. Krafla_26]|uniref:hypothetical protein n=1 Tax=Niallia sp. Krafla_26 TaxID=3064703 RepID=UPI003D173B52
MPKSKILQANEATISTEDKRVPRKKRRRIEMKWSQLFRFSILLFLVGMVVFHYYLITENALIRYYQAIWKEYKQILSPILLVFGYTLLIFLTGVWIGKRRK